MVFLIPVLDKWLLYAPLHKTSALINHSAARILREQFGRDIPGELGELGRLLASEPPIAAPKPIEGEFIPSCLGIIPTRGCNMHCIYCNFGGPSANKDDCMSPELAVDALDWAAGQLEKAGKSKFHVQFFGGEPFVAQELVEIVIHRARYLASQKDLIPYFDVSSNGLFSERQCEYIGDYFDAIVLSLDGPAEFQDKNRPVSKGRGSSSIVERTARILSDMPVSLCLRMCVTEQSVTHMESIIQWMINEFNPSIINFETLTPCEATAESGIAPPDPYLFAINAERAILLAEQAGVTTVSSSMESSEPRLSFCPVGNDVAIVSPDGRVSGCYLLPDEWEKRGLNFDFGHWKPGEGITILPDRLQAIRQFPVLKPRCEACFCQFSCAGGCHVNQTLPGGSYELTDFCIQTRILTACRLLRELGFFDLSQALLKDRPAMERLAYQLCKI
jgi:uncharacterized protein